MRAICVLHEPRRSVPRHPSIPFLNGGSTAAPQLRKKKNLPEAANAFERFSGYDNLSISIVNCRDLKLCQDYLSYLV